MKLEIGVRILNKIRPFYTIDYIKIKVWVISRLKGISIVVFNVKDGIKEYNINIYQDELYDKIFKDIYCSLQLDIEFY